MAQVVTERAPVTDLGVVTGPDAAYRASIALGDHIGNHAFDGPVRYFIEGIREASPRTQAAALVGWDEGRSVDIFAVGSFSGQDGSGHASSEFDGSTERLRAQIGSEGMNIPAFVRVFDTGGDNVLEMNGALRTTLEGRAQSQDPEERAHLPHISFMAVVPTSASDLDF